MARASTPTLLSLDRFARILGISPPHFNSGDSDTVFPIGGGCSDVWFQYQWQKNDRVSREELARLIYDAEQDIARELGYYPAPHWIAQEQHKFPRHHRRDVYRRGGLNVRAQRVSVRTRFGKFIQGGQRDVDTLIDTATVAGGELVYNLAITALTATITVATALTDTCEIKVYFAGRSGAPEWEIRPERSKSIVGINVVIVFDAWMFINPDLWEAYPTTIGGLDTVDITNVANLVTSVEVRREFNDFTANAATFFWEPTPAALAVGSFCTSCGGSGCAACSLIAQNGCLHVRNTDAGIVVPTPGTYSDDDAAWSQDAFTECRDPDQVRLFYYAGDQDNRFLDGMTCEPLSDYWAHAIAWLAAARLERDLCSCSNVKTVTERLRTDLALIGETSFQVDPILLSNPFGTRRGEVQAWQRVNSIQGRSLKGGAI